MARSREEIEKDIKALSKKFENDEIDLTEYVTSLTPLQSEMSERTFTLSKPKEEIELFWDVQKPFSKDDKFFVEKKWQQQKPESVESLRKQWEDLTDEQRYKAEYFQTTPPKMFRSTLVDPVKGLIVDPVTKRLRKGTPSELLSQAMLLQPRLSPLQKRRVGRAGEELDKVEKEMQKLREKAPSSDYRYNQFALNKMKELEAKQKKLTAEFDQDPQYIEEPSIIYESPTQWALRSFNRGSALVAPITQEAQKKTAPLFGLKPEEVKTQHDQRYYKKTEIPHFAGQFITNLATNQGMMSQFYEQSEPQEEGKKWGEMEDRFDPLSAYKRGNVWNILLGLPVETVAPVSAVGVPMDMWKATRFIAKAGKLKPTGIVSRALVKGLPEVVEYPLKKLELDKVLKAVDENLSIKNIEKQARKNYGEASQQSLRAETASIIADHYAVSGAIRKGIQEAKLSGKENLSIKNLNLPESGALRMFFTKGGKPVQELPLDEAKRMIDVQDAHFKRLRATDEVETKGLAGAYQVSKDVPKAIEGRPNQVITEPRLINRNIKKTKYLNTDWSVVVDNIKALGKGAEAFSEARKAKKLLQHTPVLTTAQLLTLGKSIRALEDLGVFKGSFKSSPRSIYDATKESVSELLRENFLKGIPADKMSIGGDYVVDIDKIKTVTGRDQPKWKAHQDLVRKAIDVIPLDAGQMLLTPEAAKHFSKLESVFAIELHPVLKSKVEDVLKGKDTAFEDFEYEVFVNTVNGDVALKTLDATKLQVAGRQKTFSDIPIEHQITKIDVKPFVQSIKSLYKNVKESLPFFAKSNVKPDLGRVNPSASALAFEYEVTQAQNKAFNQVMRNLKETAKTVDKGPQLWDDLTIDYVNKYNELASRGSRSGKIRTSQSLYGFDASARKDFVGDFGYLKIEENKLVAPKQAELEVLVKETKNKEIIQKWQDLTKKIRKATETFEKKYNRKFASIDTKYNKDINSLKYKTSKAKKKLNESKSRGKAKKFKALNKALEEAKAKRTKKYEQDVESMKGEFKEELAKFDKEKLDTFETVGNEVKLIKEDEWTRDLDNPVFKAFDKASSRIGYWQREAQKRAAIKEAKDVEKSEKAAKQRAVQVLSERQGRENIYNFYEIQYGEDLRKLDPSDAYDKILEQIDEIEDKMPLIRSSLNKASLWKRVIGSYFTKPKGQIKEVLQKAHEQKYIEDAIRIDDTKPFYFDNVAEITSENLAVVVEKLRVLDPSLKQYGLKTSITGDDNFVLPIMEMMVFVQRELDVQKAIDKFILHNDNLLLDLDIVGNTTIGLENAKETSKVLSSVFEETIDAAIRTENVSLSTENDLREIVSLLKKQLSERLFDGFATDVWVNSTRDVKIGFLKSYLNEFINNRSQAIDLPTFISNMFEQGKLKSGTFASLESKAQKSLDAMINKLEDSLDPDNYSKINKEAYRLEQTELYKTFVTGGQAKAKKRFLSPEEYGKSERLVQKLIRNAERDEISDSYAFLYKKPVQSFEEMTARLVREHAKAMAIGRERVKQTKIKLKILDNLKEQVPDLLNSMKEDYYLNLIASNNENNLSLFSQQIQKVNNYINRYGLAPDVAYETITKGIANIDYLGKTNLAIIFGEYRGDILSELVASLKTDTGLKKINQLLQQSASPLGLQDTLLGVVGHARRYGQAGMLGGVADPAFRYYGQNAFTNPIIYAVTTAHKTTPVKDLLRFTGVSFSGSVLQKALSLLGEETVLLGNMQNKVSNLSLAPADDILFDPNNSKALRTYTYGQMREAITRHDILTTKVGFDFHGKEIDKMFIEAGINKLGKKRGKIWQRAWDNISPNKNNFLIEFNRFQEEELRKLVFLNAISQGRTELQAAELARKALGDYGSITKFEKDLLASWIWFWSFRRTMIWEGIKSVARGGALAPIFKMQNAINQNSYVDPQSYTSDQISRLFNIPTGKVDGKQKFLSGPQNPMMDFLNIFTSLAMVGAQDTIGKKLDEVAKFIVSEGTADPKIRAFTEWVSDDFKKGGPNRKVSPTLIAQLEEEGRLEEFVDRWNLVEVDDITQRVAGRPLTSRGTFYKWPADKATFEKSYNDYILKRFLAYTQFQLISNRGIKAILKEGEKAGIPGASLLSDLARYPLPTRGERDALKAKLFSGKPIEIIDPEGGQVKIYLSTSSKYTKGLGLSEVIVHPKVSELIYLTGLGTLTMEQKPEEQLKWNYKGLQRIMKSFKKEE